MDLYRIEVRQTVADGTRWTPWTELDTDFQSPYGATMFGRSYQTWQERLTQFRVIDVPSTAEPASGGVITEEQWDLKKHWVRRHRFEVAVKQEPHRFGCWC